MKRIVVVLALLAVACGANYSNGTRIGVVTKLSEKGIIWKSWEGSMLVALPIEVAGQTQPEKFDFNVDPAAVYKVRAALISGQRVELIYRQWYLEPLSIDNDHVVIDVK